MLVVCTLLPTTHLWLAGLDWHDQQRVFQILLLTFVGGVALVFPTTQIVLPQHSGWLIAWVGMFGFLSCLQAEHPLWAFKEWGRYLGLLLLALSVAWGARQAWFARAVLYALAAIALLNAFQFAVLYLMAIVTRIYLFNVDMLFTGFSNPRFLNQFQMLFMPLLAWLALDRWHAQHRYSRLLAYGAGITLLIHWCIALSLGGRGLWLGLGASHMALLVFFPRFWRLLAVQAAIGVGGFVLYQCLFFVIPEWLGQEAWLRSSMRFGLSKREVIWDLAWHMFLQNPWLGVGPMHFSAQINSVAAHPHQVLLQWLAEWGMFATLGACCLTVWGFIHGMCTVKARNAQPLDAALWMSLAGAFAVAQVDGVFVMPYTETWLAILIGIALARWSANEGTRQQSRWRVRSIQATALLVLAIFIPVLVKEVPHLPENSDAFRQQHETGYTPRFWVQGWLPQ